MNKKRTELLRLRVYHKAIGIASKGINQSTDRLKYLRRLTLILIRVTTDKWARMVNQNTVDYINMLLAQIPQPVKLRNNVVNLNEYKKKRS